MTTLTQFTVFPKLSNDLKAMIWDIASQEPRRIQFGYYVGSKRKNAKKKNDEPTSERDKIFSGKHPDYPYPWRLLATGRVPSVLITCRESRHWAMKHYRLDFKDQLYGKAMWYNPKVDILHFVSLTNLLLFVQGGCADINHGPIALVKDSFKMPAVERIFMASSISTHNYEIAVETAKKFPNLKSLATRTNGVDTEDVTYHSSGVVTGANNIPPSLKVRMNQLWNSDEWKAIRAYGQIPELRIYTIDELCSFRDAILVPPARRSERMKSMKIRLDVED
ncbi:hypothetical protein ACHAO8_004075 [Botrytis cinerea]